VIVKKYLAYSFVSTVHIENNKVHQADDIVIAYALYLWFPQ